MFDKDEFCRLRLYLHLIPFSPLRSTQTMNWCIKLPIHSFGHKRTGNSEHQRESKSKQSRARENIVRDFIWLLIRAWMSCRQLLAVVKMRSHFRVGEAGNTGAGFKQHDTVRTTKLEIRNLVTLFDFLSFLDCQNH